VDFERVGQPVVPLVPDGRVDPGPGQHLVRVPQEVDEQGVLAGRQVEPVPGPRRPLAGQVGGHVGDGEGRPPVAGRPASQGPDAGQQFLERERLRQVVVRAEVETTHAILHAVLCGENQHGHFPGPGAKALQHLEPAHLGQAEIEDQQVEFEARNRVIGCGAGGDTVHGVSRIPKAAHQTLGQNRVVLGDQYPHPARSPFAAARMPRVDIVEIQFITTGSRNRHGATRRRARWTLANARLSVRLARHTP